MLLVLDWADDAYMSGEFVISSKLCKESKPMPISGSQVSSITCKKRKKADAVSKICPRVHT